MLRSTLKRYMVATLGMALVALGVAISLRSGMGTSPISCPPAIFSLRWSCLTLGGFTWLVNFSFILIQLLLLRNRFRLADLMQIPAVLLFGVLCDAAVWLCQGLPDGSYALRLFYCLSSILLTAIGLRIEINARAWMLSGDKTIAVAAEVFHLPVDKVKVAFDVTLVAFSVLFALLAFGNLFGDGQHNIIREGTILLALLTGFCMRFTDPYVGRLFQTH